jgi:UDP-N-acetylglucosamine 2-epimerase (non-hydrolysing)/GDP/UDP-N,N'-diacetylbacillosamine 2-epimerase (hydrolysing)
MKAKILVITGTRAEYGLLKTTIEGIRDSDTLSLCLVATGMHTLPRFGLTINQIKKDGIKVNHSVKISEQDDMLGALSKEIEGIKKVCLSEQPAAILVLGDRDEPFAGAIVGGHLKIPVLHIHGGDVSGYSVDQYIRDSITKFSHLHFTASQKSYKRVISLGEEKWRVFRVGAPGLDNIRNGKYLTKKELAIKMGLDVKKKWLILLQHPTPLENAGFDQQISPTLKAVSKISAEKVVIYPNNDSGCDVFIAKIQKLKKDGSFHIHKNLDRHTYLSLLKTVDILVGNSSSGIIEAGFFRLPVVNIGNRQLGRECGQNVIHTNYNQQDIRKAITLALSEKFRIKCRKLPNPYGIGRAGVKIVDIIEKNINNPGLFYKRPAP